MALRIADKGLQVVLTYQHNKAEAEATVKAIEAKGQKAFALSLDTASIASFSSFADSLKQEMQKHFGRTTLDYLVNNAGIGWNAPVGEATEEQFDALINIHFKGVVFLTQTLLPMLENGGGIVNISSGLTVKTLPGPSVYAAAKGAMEIFTRYQAKELGFKGIRANIVAPGAIATDFNGGAVRDNEVLHKAVADMIPLGRVEQAEDIGGVVAFLCTEDARWINGQRIEVSGGQTL
jgi:NAD(P)-dependent dehydrogenase (short-subunit alcohol dehydrogenase family)